MDDIRKATERVKTCKTCRTDNTVGSTKVDVYYFDHGHLG